METELLDNNGDVTTGQPATKVIKYSVTDAGIAKLEEQYKEVPADLTVKANYELVKKAASHIRGLRGDVEKHRKGLKAESLAYGKLVDSTAKEIITRLKAIEEPYSMAKKNFDTAVEIAKREAALAEEKRVDDIAERIVLVKSRVESNISSSSETIQAVIDEMHIIGLNIPEWAMEFADKADQAVKESIVKLAELHAMKLQQETFAAQQAEAEADRLQQEKEARKQREIDAEAERIEISAEREAMEEERLKMKAEQDRLAKDAEELAAKLKAEQDEKDAAQELINAEIAAYAEQAEMDQAVKDAEIEADRERMAAEIEALKKANEPVVIQEVVDAERAKEETKEEAIKSAQKEETPGETPNQESKEVPGTITIPEEDYKAAGQAMIKYIGNRKVTKDLLDAIVNNEVPNIKFTGEV